jgi:hypothetical protein
MWFPHSPDLNLYDFHLWGTLTNKMYNNNPCTEDDLKQSIQDVVPSISPAELQCIIKKITFVFSCTPLFHVTSICKLIETTSSTFFKHAK